VKTLELTADRSGERLDTFVARRCPELSRSHARRLIDDGLVSVNGRHGKASERVTAGLNVQVTIPPPETIDLTPETIPLTIIYQDADIIVLDKPDGLTVHPAPGHPSGTLVNALLAACPDLRGIAGTLRPGIVHRLDKETSGVMVLTKTAAAFTLLLTQFRELQSDEKIRLVQDLWDEIAEEVARRPLTEAQRRLLDERILDEEQNPDDFEPWSKAKEDILRNL